MLAEFGWPAAIVVVSILAVPAATMVILAYLSTRN
jgi:hypothetical protein